MVTPLKRLARNICGAKKFGAVVHRRDKVCALLFFSQLWRSSARNTEK
jgi:hypothetical protein